MAGGSILSSSGSLARYDAPISGWSPRAAGLCKRTLLREVVLPSLATNRALQRIIAEYIEQLDAVQPR